MKRAEKMLDECKEILKQRGEQYGDAKVLYKRTASAWTAYLGLEVDSEHVCTMMSLMKLARLDQGINPDVRRDTYIDMINYIALAESLEEDGT